MNEHLIGIQISNYRKAAGMTQEELGEAVGISGQAVSRWECGGAPDISLLPAIADRLGVTIDGSVLLVDEGTSALDEGNADRIERNLLSKTDLTLILVSHHLSAEQKKRFSRVYALSGDS